MSEQKSDTDVAPLREMSEQNALQKIDNAVAGWLSGTTGGEK